MFVDAYVASIKQPTELRRDAPPSELSPVPAAVLQTIAALASFLRSEPVLARVPLICVVFVVFSVWRCSHDSVRCVCLCQSSQAAPAPELPHRFGIRRARVADLLVSVAELRMDVLDAALAGTMPSRWSWYVSFRPKSLSCHVLTSFVCLCVCRMRSFSIR